MKLDDKYSIHNLQYRHYHYEKTKFCIDKIGQLTDLYTQSFMTMNEIWKKLNIPRQQVYNVMRDRVIQGMEHGIISVMVVPKTEQIAMATISMDLFEYQQLKNNSSNKRQQFDYVWWKAIKNLAHELEDQYVDALKPKRWEYLYGDVGACKKDFATKANTQYFWILAIKNVSEEFGFKTLIGRSSNPISKKLMGRMGSQFPKKVHFKLEGMEDSYMELIVLEINKTPLLLTRTKL